MGKLPFVFRYSMAMWIAFTSMSALSQSSKQRASWSERLSLFYTQWANDFMKSKAHSMVSAANQQRKSIDPDRTDFAFTCPGYSFLVGVASKFDVRPYDRMFRFICAFLDGDDKLPLEKRSCTKSPLPYTNIAGKAATLSCKPNEAIHGLASAMRPALDMDDRLYKPLCCQVKGADDTAFVPESSSCSTSKATSAGNSFEYKCAKNKVLVKIETLYDTGDQDRQFKFTCCPLVTQ